MVRALAYSMGRSWSAARLLAVYQLSLWDSRAEQIVGLARGSEEMERHWQVRSSRREGSMLLLLLLGLGVGMGAARAEDEMLRSVRRVCEGRIAAVLFVGGEWLR